MVSSFACSLLFQSTCHIRGMTCITPMPAPFRGISIHMPHTWHDLSIPPNTSSMILFQSTCHIRGMTRTAFSCASSKQFQSTCHIRGMTATYCVTCASKKISIHMPHTWHDVLSGGHVGVKRISIHMPHTWHDSGHGGRAPDRLDISIHMPHTWHDA